MSNSIGILRITEGSSGRGSGYAPGPAGMGGGPVVRKKNSVMRELVEWVLYILMAFVLASLIQSEVFALTEVNMSSMETTLLPKDKLVMYKLAYRFAEPKNGDILIFLKDESADGFVRRVNVYLSDVAMKLHGEFRRNRLIKRVIAVPGDTLEIKDNQVIVNGQVLNEPYARIDPDENQVMNGELAPITIPAGEIFVMGDNRGKSMDSRSFGLVDITSVEGKAVFRVMPVDKFGKLYP
jgi:signal peptidase I